MRLLGEGLSTMLAGVSRKPLPPGATALQVLALTGQALRFELPALPLKTDEYQSPVDRRAILPGHLRRPLLRLLTGKPATEHAAAALAEAFDRRQMRPHPFDLPRLDGFVRAYAPRLGTTAQFWAGTKTDYVETLDADNWMEALPAARIAYLKTQRETGGGLALLEAVWAKEPAELRLRLLAALQTGLNAGDATFLDFAAQDRAPRVRALAVRLRSRLPGATGENPALKAVVERIEKSEAGLLRKRPVLKLELPATVKEHMAAGWLRENFADVSYDELAGAFGLGEQDLAEAVKKDANLLLACALMATADGRPELLDAIAEHLPQGWELLYQAGLQTLEPMTYETRLRWAEAVIRPYGRRLPGSYLLWSWLHRVLEGPAPASLFAVVLSGSWLADLEDLEKQGPQWTELLAALCPPARYVELQARLRALDPAYTGTALALLEILIAMETHG